MAKRRFAQASLNLTTSMFMVLRQRLADISGTIPMPAPASTMRQTASKDVTRALMFKVAPRRVAWPTLCRAARYPEQGRQKRSTTSAKARVHFRAVFLA
jgi:hypothetical protein